MGTSQLFIRLLDDREEVVTPDEVVSLLKYCKSVAGDYALEMTVIKDRIKIKMQYREVETAGFKI